MTEVKLELSTPDAKMYINYEQDIDCPILTIQIVEGRFGPNSIVMLVDKELEQFKEVMRRIL